LIGAIAILTVLKNANTIHLFGGEPLQFFGSLKYAITYPLNVVGPICRPLYFRIAENAPLSSTLSPSLMHGPYLSSSSGLAMIRGGSTRRNLVQAVCADSLAHAGNGSPGRQELVQRLQHPVRVARASMRSKSTPLVTASMSFCPAPHLHPPPSPVLSHGHTRIDRTIASREPR
jgi:hypothetical protein